MIELAAILQAAAPELGPGLVKSITGYENQRDRQLNRIEASVDASLAGPYRAARRDLQSAAVPGRTTRERNKYILRAINKLRQAEANLTDTHHWRLCHDAQLTLAGLYRERNSIADADQWARIANETAVEGVRSRVAEVNRTMNLTVGRIKFLGSTIPVAAFAVIVLWVVLNLFAGGRLVSQLPFTLSGFFLAFVIYMEFKHHYQVAVGWWLKRKLRPDQDFLAEQSRLCKALTLPQSNRLIGGRIQDVDSGERMVAFELWPSKSERVAYSAFDESLVDYFSAARLCASNRAEILAAHPDWTASSFVISSADDVATLEKLDELHANARVCREKVQICFSEISRLGRPPVKRAASAIVSLLECRESEPEVPSGKPHRSDDDPTQAMPDNFTIRLRSRRVALLNHNDCSTVEMLGTVLKVLHKQYAQAALLI